MSKEEDKKQHILQAIRKACPETMEDMGGFHNNDLERPRIKIHSLHLEHLLRAIGEKKGQGIHPLELFAIGHPASYNLPLTLEQNLENKELTSFLYSILIE